MNDLLAASAPGPAPAFPEGAVDEAGLERGSTRLGSLSLFTPILAEQTSSTPVRGGRDKRQRHRQGVRHSQSASSKQVSSHASVGNLEGRYVSDPGSRLEPRGDEIPAGVFVRAESLPRPRPRLTTFPHLAQLRYTEKAQSGPVVPGVSERRNAGQPPRAGWFLHREGSCINGPLRGHPSVGNRSHLRTFLVSRSVDLETGSSFLLLSWSMVSQSMVRPARLRAPQKTMASSFVPEEGSKTGASHDRQNPRTHATW
ncbi:hypothetical protein B0T22DRAFT_85242 [Podospora appendiculata]|uniref:Uncharacterized protein n=1 Tax=Podospora appendiculata TaxID=314037 RepID=A0AAE0XK58_9PEZI|nr:hypothetical protein B0T22DRAFT_85242 [Podospora appendiculata]